MERSRLVSILCSLSFVVLLLILQSCDEDERIERKQNANALKAYNKIMKYALRHHRDSKSSATIGRVSGSSAFLYQKNSIAVKYSAIGQAALEVGDLSGFYMYSRENDYSYTNYVVGKWRPYGSGSGDVFITLSKDNWLTVRIHGNEWEYRDSYWLDSPDYVLKVLAEAAEKSDRIKLSSREEKKRIRKENEEKKKIAQVKTPLEEGATYVCIYNKLQRINVITAVNAGREFYLYKITQGKYSDGKEYIELNSIERFMVVGEGEFRKIQQVFPYEKKEDDIIPYSELGSDYERMKSDKKGNILFRLNKKRRKNGEGGHLSGKREDAVFVKANNLEDYNIPIELIPPPNKALIDGRRGVEYQNNRYCFTIGGDGRLIRKYDIKKNKGHLPEKYMWLVNNSCWYNNPGGHESPCWFFYEDYTCEQVDSDYIDGEWVTFNLRGEYSIRNGGTIVMKLEDTPQMEFGIIEADKLELKGRSFNLYSEHIPPYSEVDDY